MKKSVVIHVGPPKTGTTSIQKFLFDARPDLLKSGVLYANSGLPQPGESYLVRRAYGIKKVTEGIAHNLLPWTLLGEVEGHTADHHWSQLASEISETSAHCVVISSEGFCKLTRQHVERVRHWLQGHRVIVVSYVREPFSRILSDYGQRLKAGTTDQTFGAFIRGEERLLKNYDSFLANWQQVFGADSIVIRSFDRARRRTGLEMDFAELILDEPETISAHLPVKRMNRSPGPGVLNVLRNLNRLEARLGKPAATRRAFAALRKTTLALALLPEAFGRLIWGKRIYGESERKWVRTVSAEQYLQKLQRARLSHAGTDARFPSQLADMEPWL